MIYVERKSSSFVLSCFLSDGALSNAFTVGVCPVPDQTAWSVELMEGCFVLCDPWKILKVDSC